jgi:hypothetical protein
LVYLMCQHSFHYAVLTEPANSLYYGVTPKCLQLASYVCRPFLGHYQGELINHKEKLQEYSITHYITSITHYITSITLQHIKINKNVKMCIRELKLKIERRMTSI